jgi:hypothetical protein
LGIGLEDDGDGYWTNGGFLVRIDEVPVILVEEKQHDH